MPTLLKGSKQTSGLFKRNFRKFLKKIRKELGSGLVSNEEMCGKETSINRTDRQKVSMVLDKLILVFNKSTLS